MAQNEYILIVDDDCDIRNLLGIYLENEGYRFIKCDNALSALETVETTLVSLILLDVMMPGLDGISACMKLREKTNAPIIFISAKSDDMDVVQGLMAGGDDYVVKPFVTNVTEKPSNINTFFKNPTWLDTIFVL